MDAFRCIRYFKNCKTYRETIKEGKLHHDTYHIEGKVHIVPLDNIEEIITENQKVTIDESDYNLI